MNEPSAKPANKAHGLRRRQVLVGAGAAAGGLAITRALGLYNLGELPSLPGQTQSPMPTGIDWISPLDKPEGQVGHLLRRATFGATPAEYQQSVKDGFKTTVDRLVDTKAAEPPALAGADDATQDKPIKPQERISWLLEWMLRRPTPVSRSRNFFSDSHFPGDVLKV